MFFKTSNIKQNSTAFVPDSLRFVTKMFGRNQLAYSIHAYWHETIQGQPVVSYGVVTAYFKKEPLIEAGLNYMQLTYDNFLDHARLSNPPGPAINRHAAYKQRSPKDMYSNKAWILDFSENVFDDYLPTELQNMLANPLQVPSNADGWYSLNSQIA
jgi:hypothetical protein